MTDDPTVPVISTGDLENYLGDRYNGDDLTYVVALTNSVIRGAWAQPVQPVPPEVKARALAIADRAYSNPQGLSSWTTTVDDGSRTERLPDDLAQAGVFLTDQERASLAGDSPSSIGAFTMRTRPAAPSCGW